MLKRTLFFIILIASLSCATSDTKQGRNEMDLGCDDCNVIIFNFSSLNKSVLKQYESHDSIDLLNLKKLPPPLIFKNNFTTSNWPFQALASIHTGKYVENHKIFNNKFHNQIDYGKFQLKEDVLPEDTDTLIKEASKNNYHTIFWGGAPHPSFYSRQTGTMRGANVVEEKCLHYLSDVKELNSQIDASPGKFFGFINIVRPHFPHFILPSDYKNDLIPAPKNSFIPETEEQFLVEHRSGWKKINKQLLKHPDLISKNQKELKSTSRDAFWYIETARQLDKEKGSENFRAHYKRSILYSSEMINMVINHLDEKKMLEKTIIIITSDVGDNYLADYKDENGNSQYSAFTYMMPSVESYTTPLIFYFPTKMADKLKSTNVDSITNHTDFLPSLKALMNWSGPSDFDGENMFSSTFTKRTFSRSFNFRPHNGIRLGFHNSGGSLIKYSTSKKWYFDFATKRILSGNLLMNDPNAVQLSDWSRPFDGLFENDELNEMSKKVDNIYKN